MRAAPRIKRKVRMGSCEGSRDRRREIPQILLRATHNPGAARTKRKKITNKKKNEPTDSCGIVHGIKEGGTKKDSEKEGSSPRSRIELSLLRGFKWVVYSCNYFFTTMFFLGPLPVYF